MEASQSSTPLLTVGLTISSEFLGKTVSLNKEEM